MKSLAIAVLLGVLLVYSTGTILSECTDVQLVLDSDTLNPMETLFASGVVGVILVVVGFFVAVSVIGVLALTVGAVFLALLVAGISAFWPALLLLAIVVWLVKDNRSNTRV
ncbi:hypothetical protein OE749_18250 [Aestuariibacter sp. AA17]|uniref:Uncharacterized protein n=1 Tax=Fluctibacter corallii TaxID=2984329 RepID=A0ABT3ADA1_9ALTE|nr:hypothetical protein [Aestuariibacter sp. AA17]MCV2886641.1 hypothetical protein [Aestuariibacter sp. AA17]